MTNNHFEKRIQEKLNQFEIEPSENLLENIFEKRAAKSKSVLKFSFFKLGIAMLSLALITAVILLNRNSSGSSAVNTNNNTVVNTSELNGSKTLKNESGAEESNISEANNSKISDNMEANSNHSGSEVNKQSVAKRPIVKTERKVATIGGVKNTSKRKQLLNPLIVKYSETGKNGNAVKVKAEGIKNYDVYNDNGYNIEERYFNIDAGNKPRVSFLAHQGNSHLIVYHSVNKERIDKLDLNYLFLKPMRAIPLAKYESEQVAMIDYQSFKNSIKNRKPVFIDLLFSPVLSLHSVNGNDKVNGNYRAMSQNSFNNQYSLRISYPVSRKINLFTGFGYMDLTTDFKGDMIHGEDGVRYETVTSYINDPILGTIAFTHIDTINFHKDNKINYNFKNTYQVMTLPIGVSYNFGYRNLDFGLHGSALFNVYTNAKGSNADFANNRTTTFSSGKKHFSLGGGISFMAAYKLSSRFKLIVEPGLQYFKINSQKNGNVVNENVLNTGLSLGLRYSVF